LEIGIFSSARLRTHDSCAATQTCPASANAVESGSTWPCGGTSDGNELVQIKSVTYLDHLEAQAIHAFREVVAECKNPVLLYSIGKDSGVLLHLARKAFYPAKLPFPLLHIDTTWKFKEMYKMRDRVAASHDLELLVYTNPDAVAKQIDPFKNGASFHTHMWKTEGLKQALDLYGFDAAFGGARRDEEASRAKERICSFRSRTHAWDPRNQRPELWDIYNLKKKPNESVRVFPLSNWTELDVWLYTRREAIDVMPLYFAAERSVIIRDGQIIMLDDDRFPLAENEVPVSKSVRFRTLGCYPLTGAIESHATNMDEMILEMMQADVSERQGRLIDFDQTASMEKKKLEGYF
jgi:sulfate adenylyltransferase subunit 2